jgi:hypothetical protein
LLLLEVGQAVELFKHAVAMLVAVQEVIALLLEHRVVEQAPNLL